ncbi:MAG: LuxR C-terminal-related transcriptional regulator [Anaerolineae bacterium]
MSSDQNAIEQGLKLLRNGEWQAARQHFETLVASNDDPEAHDALGIALWWLNRVDNSHQHRTKAYIGFKQQGETRRAARIASWLAREQVFLDANVSAMRGWFARAERLLDSDQDCVEWGWLLMFRASMLATPPQLEQESNTVLQLAARFNDPDLEIMALANQGLSLIVQGDILTGMKRIDEAMTAATGGEATDYMTISEVFCVTLSACEIAGDLVRTEHWCQVATRFAEQRAAPFLSAYCRTTYGSLLAAMGRWEAADSALSEAMRAFEAGHRGLRVHALLKLADLRVRQGRLEEAEILLTGYEDHPEAIVPLARLHLTRSETASARALLDQALRLAPDQTITLFQLPALLLMVDVQLAQGDLESAQQTAAHLQTLAEKSQSDFLIAQVAIAQGQIESVQGGEHADPVVHYRAALDRLQAYEQSLVAARARLQMAYALRDSDQTGAIMWAKAAYASLTRLGAARDADEAQKLLREMGVLSRSPQRTRLQDALTERELEILALIANGLTNPKIAARLYLSVKTVEYHVSQILGKLGVRSRAEAAALAARQSDQSNN